MRTEKELIKTSRYLSKLLRHDPDDLQMDSNGWIKVNDLLNKIDISLEELDIIVETNDKKRFRYNEDKSKIRANQGHSINVDVQLDVKEPPHRLYHGTAYRNKESILKNGIVKMKRQHVHLSQDIDTALNVAKRHCKNDTPIIFEINSKLMSFDGYKFYLSNNDVWLTDYISTIYIKEYIIS